MQELIGGWVGKTVNLTLHVGGLAGGAHSEGKLLQVNDAGILLQSPKVQTFVPLASILHISLLERR